MKIRRTSILLLTAGSLLLTSGCQLKREINTDNSENEKPMSASALTEYSRIELNTTDFDNRSLVTAFFQMPYSEAEKYKYPEKWETIGTDIYEYSSGFLSIASSLGMIMYEDEQEGAASCYSSAISLAEIKSNYLTDSLRKKYPAEELDSCSSEEVLSFCEPIAAACGFSDYTADTYAITAETLRGPGYNAPNPEYEYIPMRSILELKDQGRDEEARELSNNRNSIPLSSGLHWEKKHEAILVVYRNKIDGLVLDAGEEALFLLYVPYYGKVIFADGGTPSTKKTDTDITAKLSAEEALQEAFVYLNADKAEDVTILCEELVWSYRRTGGGKGLEKRFADPCWRIEYELGESFSRMRRLSDPGIVFIDAVDGHVLIND